VIVFDLVCGGIGHVFEAWFGSTEDYESQHARGLVSCPLCGNGDVRKAPMSPRVGAKGNSAGDPVPAAPPAGAPLLANHAPAEIKALLRALSDHQARMLDKSDYVGARFADEARAIHLGDEPVRPIHGQATSEEAQALRDEGIAVAALPFPVRPPGIDN
jgi:hypothetical protein